MPLLQIANDLGELDGLSFTRLFGVMLFPDDPGRQEELVAVCQRMEGLREDGAHDVRADLGPVLRRSDLLGDLRRRVDCAMAGTVLLTVRKMEQEGVAEASVHKAVSLVEAQLRELRQHVQFLGPKTWGVGRRANRKDLMQAWSTLRPVAHFWSALMILGEADKYGGFAAAALSLDPDLPASLIRDPETLRLVLGLSENMRLWGEAHRTRGGLTTLRPDETWRIPSGLASVCATLVMPPLSAMERLALAKYEAPMTS